MYAFFDFHKEKVNIFFELFMGLTGLQAYRLTGLPSDCSTALPFDRSSVNLLAKKKSCIIVVRVIISCIFAFAILRRI